MSTAAVSAAEGRASERRPSRARTLTRTLGVPGTLSLVLIVLVFLAAILAPLIAPHDPEQVDILSALQGPSSAHLLGTDDTGRDLLSRLIYGARPALLGATIIIVAATTLGTSLAIATAWIGGRFDAAVSRLIDVGFAFPGLLTGVLAVAVFGAGLVAPIIALTIAYVPFMARVLRSAALRERNLPYIAACTVQGFSPFSVCLRHILPNIAPLIVIQATIAFGYAIIDLAGLSFLGLGIQPPTPDWGSMVANGQQGLLSGTPEQSLYAAALIVLTVLSFLTLGERLNRRREAAR